MAQSQDYVKSTCFGCVKSIHDHGVVSPGANFADDLLNLHHHAAATYTAVVPNRLLTLLLCVCLALQGASVASASDSPCPMEAEMKAMVLAGDLDPADLSDCCNDMQTWAETGHLCKSGADCQVFATWAPAPSTSGLKAAPSTGPPGALEASCSTVHPGTPWRPPSGP